MFFMSLGLLRTKNFVAILLIFINKMVEKLFWREKQGNYNICRIFDKNQEIIATASISGSVSFSSLNEITENGTEVGEIQHQINEPIADHVQMEEPVTHLYFEGKSSKTKSFTHC